MPDAQPSVLFVDDTADTRALVEWTLQEEGFAVTAVETADECLEQARAGGHALFLLDIGLPDKDGLELCREIRLFDQTTPVLFYSAFADLLDQVEAERVGAQGTARKPEDTPRLAAIVRAIIERGVKRSVT